MKCSYDRVINLDASSEALVKVDYDANIKFIESIQNIVVGNNIVIVTHPELKSMYAEPMETLLLDKAYNVQIIEVESGESSKSMLELSNLLDELLNLRLDRNDTIIALGGGVIGDLVGFAASIYKRGISVIQSPTTLLAQVDACIGGKTGINHATGKNLIGTFYQPKLTFIDLKVLSSLSKRDFRSGLAEVVKYAMIMDINFFDYIEAHAKEIANLDVLLHRDIWLELVSVSVESKCKVVEADEKEKGGREILNFGHTFAHAIETYFDYGKYMHGEAVAIGMLMATKLSVLEGYIDESVLIRFEKLLTQLGFSIFCEPVDIEKFIDLMRNDKKVYNNKIYFILLNSLGVAKSTTVENDDNIKQAIDAYLKKEPV